jgi:hypothetical protein
MTLDSEALKGSSNVIATATLKAALSQPAKGGVWPVELWIQVNQSTVTRVTPFNAIKVDFMTLDE